MNYRVIPMTLLAVAMFAQPRQGPRQGPGPMKPAAVQEYLGLTDEQVQSLQKIQQTEIMAVSPISQQLQPLLRSLQVGDSDAATMEKIQALEQQLVTTRSGFQKQSLALLKPEQQTKLTALEQAVALLPSIQEAVSLGLLVPRH